VAPMRVPKALEEEHEELMGSLRRYSLEPGKLGERVRDVLEALEPHFEKEEKLAMPLLGVIHDLFEEKAEGLDELVECYRGMKEGHRVMLKEHEEIVRRVKRAEEEADLQGRRDVVERLRSLMHHAKVEEDVLYPAALLAGQAAQRLLGRRSEGRLR